MRGTRRRGPALLPSVRSWASPYHVLTTASPPVKQGYDLDGCKELEGLVLCRNGVHATFYYYGPCNSDSFNRDITQFELVIPNLEGLVGDHKAPCLAGSRCSMNMVPLP